MTLAFGRADTPIWVDPGAAALGPQVARLFAPLRRPLLDGAGAPVLRVSTAGHGWTVHEEGEGGLNTPFARVPDLLAYLEHRMALRLLAGFPSEAHLHAAGAVLRGRAVLALGPSGAGKSSLALAWSRAGHPLLGDDAVLLDEAGLAVAFPRLVKVARERLAAAAIALEETVAPDPEAPEAWFDPVVAGGWSDGRVVVGLVARVQFAPGATTRVRPMGEADTVRLLLDQSGGSGAEAVECIDRYIRVARFASGVEVVFGDAADAARALMRELEGGDV